MSRIDTLLKSRQGHKLALNEPTAVLGYLCGFVFRVEDVEKRDNLKQVLRDLCDNGHTCHNCIGHRSGKYVVDTLNTILKG